MATKKPSGMSSLLAGLVDAPAPAKERKQKPMKEVEVDASDPIFGGVLLAKKWEPDIDPTGWWMSPKLDGVRAYWNGEDFYSRNGLLFGAPQWMKEAMPAEHMDGEFYTGPGLFNETVSIVRSSKSGDLWKKVQYMVFDLPQFSGPFESRVAEIARLASHSSRKKFMQSVPQVQCRSPKHLSQFHQNVVDEGIEGTMLRQARSKYERRRSNTLLKVKDFFDDEAKIIGYQDGEGKHEGRLGAYICKLKNGKQFKVGSGMSDRERERPLPIGSMITFRYQELTPDGIPRFPTFLSDRDYE